MTKTWENLTIDDFPYKTHENVRFSDTDAFGHVNNVAFATYLETGRVNTTSGMKIRDSVPGANFVVVQLNLSYRREMHWPGRIDIGSGIKSVGKSSIRMYQALFQDKLCVATAEAILVLLNRQARSSMPLPEHVVAKLSEDLIQFDL